MWRYVIKRVVLAVFSVFIITTLTFFLMNAIPGGPFASEKAIPANVQAALEKRFNLEKPVFEQYLLYMKNILHGDFGVSMKTGRDVSRIIGEGFIPVITYVGPMIAYIITGSLVVETVFTIGGLGTQFVTSITTSDYSVIMGTTIFLAVLIITASLISDLVYKLVDPRIKLG